MALTRSAPFIYEDEMSQDRIAYYWDPTWVGEIKALQENLDDWLDSDTTFIKKIPKKYLALKRGDDGFYLSSDAICTSRSEAL